MLDRRAFLTGAAGFAFLAGCGGNAITPKPQPGLPWKALAKRLTGRVVLPGDSGYGILSRPNNLRYAFRRPAGIALCKNANDVAASILWARENGVPVVARSGGHSYAGYSTTTGLMIDVSPMRSLSFDRAGGILTVGGGARNVTVFDGCRDLGVAIPHGRCFRVGVAGLALGGGIGFDMRPNGVTSDTMTATEIVTADGTMHRVGVNDDSDLFWACRGGGGGNFGINTSFSFQTFAVGRMTAFELWWDSDLEAVFERMVAALEGAPNGMGNKVSVVLTPDAITGKTQMKLQLLGQLDGTSQQLREILQPVYALREPDEIRFVEELPYWQAEVKVSEPGLPTYFKERSRFFNQPFDGRAIATAFDWCRRWPATVKSAAFKAFQTGGAVNALPASATAFVHRTSHWLASIDIVWSEDTSQGALQKSLDWQTRFYDALVPIAKGGAYQNFIDPSLNDWKTAYYGANIARLEAVKKRVDPNDVFTFPEAIPVHAS
ncbi:MAG TPA: FAD-binding protein [Candidatus Baltobacteraceae bacterium]|jgi:FAD/FMN-containing dehydrogenase|nr:FAD-binding protein [Candidatus Baltobacteraceae bacterium]